ncbi:MAG TPA: amino acid permease [Bryobacteraceae bacterium]|nr:amino acid permease [Bryobacteraceae bacterium]
MQDLPRKLGLLEATSIVVGTVIGAGIFIVPSAIARDLPSAPMILAVWILTGVISFFGALGYAELGAMMPHSGGQYVYLREAYGPLPAFVCGWAFFLVIQSGSIAAVCVGFSLYLSYLLPGIPGLSRWAPVALIAILTFINYRGIKGGAFVQVLFTILKITGLALLIGSAFLHKSGTGSDWSTSTSAFSVHGLGLAMLGCFVAYDGWHVIAFIAGEVREPRRNLPLALGLGVLVSLAIYVLANIAYMRLLPLPEIAASERVAATAAERSMGPMGATLMTLTIILSSIGSANGSILTAPRIYFAQARDGLFFRQMAKIHPRFETPHISILIQGVWTSLLALSGSYEALFSYVLFASWLVHAMTVLGVLILRRKRPHVARPYRMWGYPVAPLLFVAFALAFVGNTLAGRPDSSLLGALIILSGVPVYYLWRSK